MISLLLLLVSSAQANVDDLFLKHSYTTGVPVTLLRAVCWVESKHKTRALNRLDRTAPSYGICQVQYATAKEFGYKGDARGLLKPDNNISVAAKYLKWLLDKADNDWKLAVTGYNRGWRKARRARRYNSYVINVLFAMKEGR